MNDGQLPGDVGDAGIPPVDGAVTAAEGRGERNLLAEFNLRQAQAVAAPPGPLLVLAGPGSGKTRVLTYRAAWLVSQQAVRPSQILGVTFTNKAAEEMRGRLETLLGPQGRDVRVHTFHGFCARVLRQYGEALELPPRFVIADEKNQAELIAGIVRQLGFSREQFPTYRVIDFISEFKRDLRDPAQASPSDELPAEMIAIAEAYQAAFRERNLLDFDDLIGQAVRLLAKDRMIRATLQAAIPHVLVDEYQDIDRAQFELVNMLVPKGGDVLAVADDAQSIYGWRGARPELIETFISHYRPTIFELEESYRSTDTILSAAQAVIRRGDQPRRRRHLLHSNQGIGTPIYHYIFATDRQEQEWLVQLVQRLVKERGHDYGDIAVLYRTHQLADALEGALLQANIPVQRVRKDSFFEEPRAREVTRYLHLVRSLSSDNLLAALNFPQTLADELTVLQLQQLADVHRLSLADLARQSAGFPELSPLTRANLAAFMRLFDEQLVPRSNEGAAAAVNALFDVLAQRRSPFDADEFRVLRDAGAFLRFADAAAALRDHLSAAGQATARVPANVDGAIAAAILSEVVERYLDARLTVELQATMETHRADDKEFTAGGQPESDAESPGPQDGPVIEILLAPGTEPLVVRPPHSEAGYSLSTVAWRLAQDLLVAHEMVGQAPVVVYDLETTGTDLRRDEIIEIGAQRWENGAAAGAAFYSLVKPVQPIPREATRVHGIHNDDLQNAESIQAVLPRFLRYVGPLTVVGHNIVRFDNRLVDRETGRLFRRGFPNPAVDTLEMARRLYSTESNTPESYALEALLRRFNLGQSVEHRAGKDVSQTATLFGHLQAENALQLGLRALPEYLPLVAAGMAAAGLALRDENAALWNAGQRMWARLGTAPGLDRVRKLLKIQSEDETELDAALARVQEQGASLAEDRAWDELNERFLAQVETFDRFAYDHSLGAFLDYQALVSALDTTALSRVGQVSLMTLHNAKGTEFPVVIILGAEEELLPLWTTLGNPSQLAEERRVFYVGLTRAQSRLYLTSVRQRDEGPLRTPSRFAFDCRPTAMSRATGQSPCVATRGAVRAA